MVDATNTPALGLLRIVPDRTRTTLLPIIQAHTRPGTIIHSDDYSTYQNAVGQLPSVIQHRIINHSQLCQPSHWCAHAAHRVVLESCETQVQTHDGCRMGPDGILFRRVHVVRMIWGNQYAILHQYNASQQYPEIHNYRDWKRSWFRWFHWNIPCYSIPCVLIRTWWMKKG